MRPAIALLLCALSLTATAQDFFALTPKASPLEFDDPVPAGFRQQLPNPRSCCSVPNGATTAKCCIVVWDEAGIEHLSLDIDTHPLGKSLRALFPGGNFVPVTVIGDGVVFGADPDRIIALARQ